MVEPLSTERLGHVDTMLSQVLQRMIKHEIILICKLFLKEIWSQPFLLSARRLIMVLIGDIFVGGREKEKLPEPLIDGILWSIEPMNCWVGPLEWTIRWPPVRGAYSILHAYFIFYCGRFIYLVLKEKKGEFIFVLIESFWFQNIILDAWFY